VKVKNKVLVVTGGGSGMGRELVLNLLRRGARVVAIDINSSTLEETKTLAGDRQADLSTYVVDITSKEAVDKFAEKVLAELGQVDGLINNAGIIQPFVKLDQLGFDAMQRVLSVNFWGPLYMIKAFLPHLLSRPEAHIVNTSSMGGFLPVPGQTIYGASKAAVKLLTEGLNSELKDSSVKVTVVFPGAVNTNITSNSGLGTPAAADSGKQSFKTLPAAKAADIIIGGMEKDRYRVLVGKDARFMDFLYRLNPRFAAGFIYKQMKTLLSGM